MPGESHQNACWAYYLAVNNLADYAWYYAYTGMGLDVLPYWKDYSALNQRPNLYVEYNNGDQANSLGWSNGTNIWLNSKYLKNVNWSTYSSLSPEAYYSGSTVCHEMSHVFYYKVTGKWIGNDYEGLWGVFLTESLSHYVGNMVWPWQYPASYSGTGKYFTETNWVYLGKEVNTQWGWKSSGWDAAKMGTWYDTAYNYKNGVSTLASRDHLWAFGFFLSNFIDYNNTSNKGLMGSYGTSTFSAYGYGGTWNVGLTLYLMKSSGYNYTFQNSIKAVYGYTPNQSNMVTTLNNSELNSKYYWYWWYLTQYARTT